MPKLKPWYTVVQPEDLCSGRPLDASEFAVHLDHVRENRAPDDYQKPARFFERTYLTRTLLDLASQVVRRLSGERVETNAIFNLATQFGGGKTHALTLLYHLANGGPLASSWRGVPTILADARVGGVPKARTAVFVGTEFDALSGRGGDGEPLRKTPWGEIAWQLGGEKAFEVVARHDAEGKSPAGDVIRRFLPEGPTLILMDELMNFVSRERRSGLADQLYNFLQNLGEEARARDNLVLAVSVPASELEMNVDDQQSYDSIKKLLDRLGKPMVMSSENESAEIIRRRLFEWHELPEDGARTAAEYADWAIENRQTLAAGDVNALRASFRDAYPFHPSVLSVFERKWQSLPRFQRTRGVLRLLALWISHAHQTGYRGGNRDPLISLGSAPLDDPDFRSALLEQLGSDQLEGPITTDIAGKADSHAARLDREASDEIRKAHLHQQVAATILFESNWNESRTEATVPEVRFAVGAPDANVADVDTVLEALVDTCYYLTTERNRYRYSLSPNLNKVLTDRRASIQSAAIDQRVKDEVLEVFRRGVAGLNRVPYPEKSGQIPDRPELTLVILSPWQSHDDPATTRFIETLVREHGAAGRTFKSALLFAVPDHATTLTNDARGALAWEDVAEDADTVQRLDESQSRQVRVGRDRAIRDLKESVWRTYKWVVLLGKDNEQKDVDLGLVHSSAAGSLGELIVNRLRADDEITESVGPHKLVRYWPPAIEAWSTKAVRDAFYSSPSLPRLLSADAVKRTIAEGVAQKILAYVGRDGDGRYEPFHFGERLADVDIEISEEMFILTAESARMHVEPPRLARLEVRSSSIQLAPGGAAAFDVAGYDQHDRPFAIERVEWSTTGGLVDAAGRWELPSVAGQYQIIARSDGVSASATGRVIEATRPGPNPDDLGRRVDPDPPRRPESGRGLRWSGAIPAQKWTTFYMKVLTKLVALPGLRLTVAIELPPSANVGDAKAEEVRTALLELGLDEAPLVRP